MLRFTQHDITVEAVILSRRRRTSFVKIRDGIRDVLFVISRSEINMTFSGWIFLSLSWLFIIILIVFCATKIFKGGKND